MSRCRQVEEILFGVFRFRSMDPRKKQPFSIQKEKNSHNAASHIYKHHDMGYKYHQYLIYGSFLFIFPTLVI